MNGRKIKRQIPDLIFLAFRFDRDRTQRERGDKSCVIHNPINCGVKAGVNDFDALAHVAASAHRPIAIKFVSEQLKEETSIRGKTFFGDAWQIIDDIVRKYPKLRWWMAADGLVVDAVLSDLDSLSPFDRIAGQMSADQSQISKEKLLEIAQKLDADGVKLKEQLQPSERAAVAVENRRRKTKAIHSFSSAIADPRFVRMVRRAIYRARERYQAALASSDDSEWTPFIL